MVGADHVCRLLCLDCLSARPRGIVPARLGNGQESDRTRHAASDRESVSTQMAARMPAPAREASERRCLRREELGASSCVDRYKGWHDLRGI